MFVAHGPTAAERAILDILRPEPVKPTMQALSGVTIPEVLRAVVVCLDRSLPSCFTPIGRRTTLDATIAVRLALALLFDEQHRTYPLLQHLTRRMAVRALTPHGDPDAE